MKHAILACYDAELNQLADLVGDFDAASTSQTNLWVVTQWRDVAARLGWPNAFEAALDTAESSAQGLSALTETAVEAFTQWLARQHGTRLDVVSARARHQSLVAIDAVASETHSLFLASMMSTRLPGSGCVSPPSAAPSMPGGFSVGSGSNPKVPVGPVDLAPPPQSGEEQSPLQQFLRLPPPTSQPRVRAFRSSGAPSYFGSGEDVTPTGCVYPLHLSLGTFPWVYGNLLDHDPPGLRWEAGRPWRPASLGMRIMASLWADPVVHLHQDARLVVAQYKRFRETTEALLEGLPVWTETTEGIAGRLYRRRGFLYAHMSSTSVSRLVGPHGAVAASTYNFVKRCFARFFAARRAYADKVASLSSAARDAYARNPDPCTKKQAIAI